MIEAHNKMHDPDPADPVLPWDDVESHDRALLLEAEKLAEAEEAMACASVQPEHQRPSREGKDLLHYWLNYDN